MIRCLKVQGCALRSVPLLYLGCRIRSTPLMTWRTQGVVGRPSFSSASFCFPELMLRVLMQLLAPVAPAAAALLLVTLGVCAAKPLWAGSAADRAADRRGAC